MRKYSSLKFLLFITFINVSYAQTLNFDQFLEISRDFLEVEKIPAIEQYFPEGYSITALDIGDFSGDSLNDFSIGLKPFRVNEIIVYFFVQQGEEYENVFTDTLNFIETPLEVGFTIKNNICFLTHKIREKNWEITGYSYEEDNLRVLDYYVTDVYPYKSKRSYGVQVYNNFEGEESFDGFYNVTTLKDIAKYPYVILPAVSWELEREKKYEIPIDSVWLLTNKSALNGKAGSLEVIRYTKHLKFRFLFLNSFLADMDSLSQQRIFIGLDSNIDRLKEVKKRTLIFRESIDSTITMLGMIFNLSTPESIKLELSSSPDSDYKSLIGLKVTYEKEINGDLIYNIYIPNSYLNLTSEIEEIGNFVLMNFKKADGSDIIFSNVKTSPLIPAGYSRLFIRDEKFFHGQYWKNRGN